ncbi:MAG: class I SAM-dependent methyltransferase [Sphingobacteriia bacterium]|nr:MAG: class I SAM-dependent methyltransferase [Sphingobacteriia bacterium]
MSSWKSYWVNNPKLFMRVMENSTRYFSNKLLKLKLIADSDNLLDYGCGPGNFAHELKGKIGCYYGVDISENYIQQANKKMGAFPEFHFIHLHTNHPINELKQFSEQGQFFHSIIIFSVVQYFNSKEEVSALLEKCKSILYPTGKIILADIIENEKGVWKDLWSICMHSLAHGYFISFLFFMARIKFSNYNTVKNKCMLLHISQAEVEEICKNMGLACSILPKITLQKSRNSFCIALK